MTHDEAIDKLKENFKKFRNSEFVAGHRRKMEEMIAFLEVFEDVEVLDIICNFELVVKGVRLNDVAVHWRSNFGKCGAFISEGEIKGVPTTPGCWDGGYNAVVCI